MKKLKKIKLNLDKEVVASLSKESQAMFLGGATEVHRCTIATCYCGVATRKCTQVEECYVSYQGCPTKTVRCNEPGSATGLGCCYNG